MQDILQLWCGYLYFYLHPKPSTFTMPTQMGDFWLYTGEKFFPHAPSSPPNSRPESAQDNLVISNNLIWEYWPIIKEVSVALATDSFPNKHCFHSAAFSQKRN